MSSLHKIWDVKVRINWHFIFEEEELSRKSRNLLSPHNPMVVLLLLFFLNMSNYCK